MGQIQFSGTEAEVASSQKSPPADTTTQLPPDQPDPSTSNTEPSAPSSPDLAATPTSHPASSPVPDVSKLSLEPQDAVPYLKEVVFKSDVFTLTSEIITDNPGVWRPHVQLAVSVRDNKTEDIIRYAGVQFHSEGCARSREQRQIIKAEVVEKLSQPLSIRLSYKSALVFGVDNLSNEWPEEIRHYLADLRQYRQDGDAHLDMSHLRGSFGISELKKMVNSLNTSVTSRFLQDFRAQPETQDASSIICPIAGWHSIEHFYENTEDGVQHQANLESSSLEAGRVHTFASLEEAMIRLSHGRYAEHLLEQKNNKNFCKGSYYAEFYRTKGGFFYAEIERVREKDPEQLDTALDQHMLLQILDLESIDFEDSEPYAKQIVFGTGQLTTFMPSVDRAERVESHRPIKVSTGKDAGKLDNSRFCLLLNMNSVSSHVRDFAVPLNLLRAAPSRRVQLKIKDYHAARIQLDAIQHLFDREGAVFKEWWGSILGETSEFVAKKNFLMDRLGLSQVEIDETVRSMVQKAAGKGFTPNTEQMAIPEDLGHCCHGLSLWRGPPGTGKTTTAAMVAEAYLQVHPDIGVLVCAPSNGSVNRVSSCVRAWMAVSDDKGHRLKPLQAHRKYHERDYARQQLCPVQNKSGTTDLKVDPSATKPNSEDAEIDDWAKAQLEAEQKRLMDSPEHGLMAAAVRAVREMNLQEQPTAHSKVGDLRGKVKVQMDHYSKALASSLTLRAYLNEDTRPKNEGKREFDRKMKDVSRQILGTRRLVISTVGNVTNLLLRESIFRDCEVIVIIVDEATLETETTMLTLIASLISPMRVSMEFGGRVPVVQLILVGDERQGQPLVRSNQQKKNVFGQQMELSLFERLVLVGFPVHTLLQQHRMAPIIRKLPSERRYGGRLRDASEVTARALTWAEETRLQDFFRNVPGNIVEYDKEDLRHLLLNVPNGRVEKDADTRSSYNCANVNVGIELFTYLMQHHVVEAKDMVILVFYNAQKVRYASALVRLEKTLELPGGTLYGCVETTEAFQGRERKCVILDLVLTELRGGLRFRNVADEKRMNVACSRARDYFYVIGTLNMLDSVLQSGRKEYVLELLQRLKKRKAYCTF